MDAWLVSWLDQANRAYPTRRDDIRALNAKLAGLGVEDSPLDAVNRSHRIEIGPGGWVLVNKWTDAMPDPFQNLQAAYRFVRAERKAA